MIEEKEINNINEKPLIICVTNDEIDGNDNDGNVSNCNPKYCDPFDCNPYDCEPYCNPNYRPCYPSYTCSPDCTPCHPDEDYHCDPD